MPPAPALSHVAEQVRHYDRDRFVAALFAPAEQREALFALYAFNVEVAKVREVVSEPILGQMRLQWWRDTVAQAYEDAPPPPHPVAGPLAGAIRRHGLDRAEFERLIEGREKDLADAPAASLADLESYAEATSATVTRLALAVLGARGVAETEAGRHVGIAWALIGVLRAAGFHAAAGRLYLPTDLLAEEGVHTGEVLAGRASPGLARVAAKVAAAAEEHLAAARRRRADVPRRALPALLPAVQAGYYLHGLRRRGNDVFAPRWATRRPIPLRLALAAFAGRY